MPDSVTWVRTVGCFGHKPIHAMICPTEDAQRIIRAWAQRGHAQAVPGGGYWLEAYSDPERGCSAISPRIVDVVNEAIDDLCQLPSVDECWTTAQEAVKAEVARRERWQKTTTEIASLPQLFIAV